MMDFNNIPEYNAPMPFWFWNGNLNFEKLKNQMKIMREAGIDEFIIHARTGLKTPFLSEEWFHVFEQVVQEAKKTDMRLWIYDEFNWPSGSAGGIITKKPEAREHYLDKNNNLNVTECAPEISPDYLNKKVTEEFIRLAYESYYQRFKKYFSKTIAGFYNDEVRFANARPWSAFLGDHIPEGPDYFKTIGQALTENYFKTLSDWCTAHKVQLIGHVMGEETLGNQVRYVSTIFPILKQFHQPGIDHLAASAQGMHPLYAASVAYLKGNLPVTCETGGGCPWDITITDLYRLSGWLYLSGVTRIILHGFFYEENHNDWPPEMFFRWNEWDKMKQYIEWAKQIQYFLKMAQPAYFIAIYYPFTEFIQNYVPDERYTLNFQKGPKVQAEKALALHIAVQELGAEFKRNGINYILVPEEDLDQIENMLLITPLDTDPEFKGKTIQQGSLSAEECIAQIDKIMDNRIRITGFGAAPNPLPATEHIYDPYLHENGDDGGILVREFIYKKNPAFLIWNANPVNFQGKCHLPQERNWFCYNFSTKKSQDMGKIKEFNLELHAYNMLLVCCAK